MMAAENEIRNFTCFNVADDRDGVGETVEAPNEASRGSPLASEAILLNTRIVTHVLVKTKRREDWMHGS